MEKIIKMLKANIKKTTGFEPQISISTDLLKGDLTTNAALKTTDPMKTGEKIVEKIRQNKELYSHFEKIELVRPGFINFYVSQGYISKQLESLLSKNKKVEPATKSLIFEFGDPNPFKEPHIGHLRNLVLGEAISRLLEANSWQVIRADYQGDVGMHVAKAVWGVIKLAFDIEKITSSDLGKAYTTGAKAYEESEDAKKEIEDLNKMIYSKDSSISKLWKRGRKVSLDYFEELYKLVGVKYDKYYFESQTAPVGLKIVKETLRLRSGRDAVFEEHDGATVYRGEKAGLHTRVFITGEGNPTYEAKDLGLAFLKDKDFPKADKSIIMTANEQVEYFKVMLAALSEIDKNLADKTSHLSFGFVNLKEGKMSSRSGNIVNAFWLIEEVKKRVKKEFPGVSSSVLEDITLSAVKWSMLKFSRESNISFDIKESVQIEGNSGPYMLYTYARTASLLAKSEKALSEAKTRENFDDHLLALARIICQFDSVKKSAADAFSPNVLANYLFTLAQSFNTFYEKEKVIGSEGEEEKLFVILAVGKVLKDGLNILGISTPEKI